MLTQQAFADWLENPVTLQMMATFKSLAETLKEDAQERMWNSLPLDQASQFVVAEIKGKVEFLEQVASWVPEDCDVLGIEKAKEKNALGW